MYLVHVFVHLHPGCAEAFAAESARNAECSRQEPGVVRFDTLRQADDPSRFLLVEQYRTPDDAAAHKATAHYARWRDAVAPMMAEPRRAVVYTEAAPGSVRWE